jgi:hypothetical protein
MQNRSDFPVQCTLSGQDNKLAGRQSKAELVQDKQKRSGGKQHVSREGEGGEGQWRQVAGICTSGLDPLCNQVLN